VSEGRGSILEVRDLRVASGAIVRVDGLDLSLATGGCTAILGPNGAGKTASVEAIAGLLPKAAGSVMLDGEDISRLPASAVVRKGLALVPQWRELFPNFSVGETLLAGSNAARGRSPIPAGAVYDLFPRLAERRRQLAGSLSGGEQQMLAIGRALMTNPRLLILDEATEGLAPLIRAEIWQCLTRLKAEGQSILVIDKNVEALIRIADRHYLMERGKVVWTGTSRALAAAPAVQHRYLGV